jgi:hypothetical protein
VTSNSSGEETLDYVDSFVERGRVQTVERTQRAIGPAPSFQQCMDCDGKESKQHEVGEVREWR